MKKLLLLLAIATVILTTHTADAQWQQTRCPSGGGFIPLAVSGNNIFAGTQDSGIYLSDNNGASWTVMNQGLGDAVWINAFAVLGNNIFAGTQDSGIFLSVNNGTSWTTVNNDYDSTLSGTVVSSFAISGRNILAGTDFGIYFSSDSGGHWASIDNGLPEVDDIFALAVSGNNWFAGTDSGVFLSLNGGMNWTAADSGLPPDFINVLAISGGNVFAAAFSGLYLSVNNGKSWTAVNKGLTDSTVISFAVSGNHLFAGTDGGGVFLSLNNGASWIAVDSGLPPNTAVSSLVISGSNLFAGTETGVYVQALSDFPTGIKTLEEEETTITIYPNPTQGMFNVQCSMFNVRALEVYNRLGQKVYQTLNVESGTSRNIDLSSQPTGMYFLKVTTPEGTVMKKIVKE